MTMTPRLRKLTLTAHITVSVGWIGADAAFLALAVAGLSSHDPQVARGAYPAMGIIAWFVIVPLSFASLLTGLVQSLGTQWGLFRHYWIVVKFLIAVFAIIVLLIHTQPVGVMADAAAKTAIFDTSFHGPRVQLAVAAGAGLLVLVVAAALAVHKPRGVTPYGWRKQREHVVKRSQT
jgi:K+-sensing histidine kinase KdpD